MSTPEGYQPLDTGSEGGVELQPAAVKVEETKKEEPTPAPAPAEATPIPAPAPAATPAAQPAVVPAQQEKKVETKEEKKAETRIPVGSGKKPGYIAPAIPLRPFSRFATYWVAFSFPIMLVHLGICLVYISNSYSFVTAAFENAGTTVQYLITSIVKQDANGFAVSGSNDTYLPVNSQFSCNMYTGDITTKGLIAASLSCATLLDYAGSPMLDNFPSYKGAGERQDVPEFPNSGGTWMSASLCQTFTPFDDYDSYPYDYLLDGVAACEIANEIVPTNVQVWDANTNRYLPDSVKKPKDKALTMVYVYFFPMAGFVILMALYNYKYFLPWLRFVEPFTMGQLIKLVFRGQADGLFMASYQWNDHPTLSQQQMRDPPNQKFQGILPRKIATLLPHSWLDIENLIPGTQIKPACNNAAKNAKFTFGFISADYFKSANCGVEWTEIERRPGECILFAYPSTPQDKLEALEKMGHKIFKVPDVFDRMSPEWLMEYMICSQQANFLFANKTPPINEGWLSTLRYYFPTPDNQWWKFNLPILCTYLALLGWHIGWSAQYSLFSLYKNGDIGTLGIFAFFLPVIGLAVTIYFMARTYGTGFAHHQLPDACLLLFFLHKMGIINTVKFYTNCLEQADPELKLLAQLEIIKFVDDIMEADVRLINIDKLDDLPAPRNSDAIWASVGFMQLPQSVRDRIGSFIVGEKVPSCQIEFLAVKILMAAFQCPSTDSLDVGKREFRQLKLKRVLE